MSRSLNRVMLIGHVGAEPDVRTTNGGGQIAKVSLATSRTYNDRSGGKQERTEWHRLTFFGKVADVVAQYVHKGDRIYIDGRLEYSQSEGQDGQVRYYTDIIVNDLVLLGGKAGSRGDDGDGFPL